MPNHTEFGSALSCRRVVTTVTHRILLLGYRLQFAFSIPELPVHFQNFKTPFSMPDGESLRKALRNSEIC